MFSVRNRNVMIVDDQPNNLRVLFTYLQGRGMKVLIADSGKRAIEQAERQPPDIILMDVMMPGMDGFATCRQLKRHRDLSTIPVIFMTALTEMKDKLTAFSAGGVDYVTKPFQQEEVLARLTAHLTIQDLQKQLQSKNKRLEKMLAEVKTLRGILPICSKCKMVRDDKGYWKQVEMYVAEHTEAQFSHSYRPSCLDKELSSIDSIL
jgi:DNA-binding response OmpR family regulator